VTTHTAEVFMDLVHIHRWICADIISLWTL